MVLGKSEGVGGLSDDRHLMDQALRLAARGLGRTRPNPVVGCVIVAPGGRVVGRGFHRRAGEPHAEVEALREAGELARGATVYVTLEPCSHHGRTPPCAEALVAAGVARVVAAMVDPNPRVAGNGLMRLMEAGIQVVSGVREPEARALNAPFISWIGRGRPLLTLKGAASLDGKIATRGGESQWITGLEARRRGHRLRDTHDAILTGVGTVVADNPRLTCRHPGGRDPVRVVVDSTLRLPDGAAVFTSSAGAPLWIATTRRSPEARRQALAAREGVEILLCRQERGGRVDLGHLLELLGKREITSVLAEGGGTLGSALLEGGLVDRLALFLAPLLIGGGKAAGVLDGLGFARLGEAPRVADLRLTRLGADLLLEGEVVYP